MSQLTSLKEYFFTFGQIHTKVVNGQLFNKDRVVVISAESYGKAREIMFEHFGQKWAFQYKECPDMKFFPGGLIELNKPEKEIK